MRRNVIFSQSESVFVKHDDQKSAWFLVHKGIFYKGIFCKDIFLKLFAVFLQFVEFCADFINAKLYSLVRVY
jgi:hypothetical protein